MWGGARSRLGRLGALLGAAALASACVDDEAGETSDTDAGALLEPVAPPPPLELGVPAAYDYFDFDAGPYEFTPLRAGGPLRVEFIPPGACLMYRDSIVLLLRSEGFELPEERFDWSDPRTPRAAAVLSTTDERGEPLEEVVSIREYPVWFEPDDDGALLGELWLMPTLASRTPAELEGAAVRLELELAVAGREPARQVLEFTLEFERFMTVDRDGVSMLQAPD
ncbi:MAG: hypothetical protein KC468_05885 [Myxococcales bacterium]|nr:hypothetical protein [Myxococcales bacterium]